MTTAFPSIEPSSRSFKAPVFPAKSHVAQSGVTTRRLYASLPSQAELKLEFRNIADTNVTAIMTAYKTAKGAVDDLSLPDIVFNGADVDLANYLDGSSFATGLKWCFAEGSPPTIASVAPGRSNVSVSLVGELRMS
jgi:hypothetical protein|tara:strand:+ start:840 stop:1247 length:408 start_codon:yes stop_codon:yes gene_type:complete